MTTYSKPDGTEIVVCDGCGIAKDGSRPDLAALSKVDHSAGLQAHLNTTIGSGAGDGAALSIRDYCPPCDVKRKRPAQ